MHGFAVSNSVLASLPPAAAEVALGTNCLKLISTLGRYGPPEKHTSMFSGPDCYRLGMGTRPQSRLFLVIYES